MFRNNLWTVLVAGLSIVGFAACDDDPTDPIGDGEAPSAPTNLTTTAGSGGISLSWSASSGADSYAIQRQNVDAGGAFIQLAADVTGTSYTDTTAEVDVNYAYRVLAANEEGSSPASDPAVARIPTHAAQYTVINGNYCDEDLAGAEDCKDVALDLTSGNTYMVSGILRIGAGGSLNIEAGTTIVGNLQAVPSAIFVEQGGQIFSEGTADRPVIFTSQRVVEPGLGEPQDGDWAGIVINGYAQCSFPEDPCVAEGGAGSYGGEDDTDDSGRIVYTRIEYGGYEVSFGNELNALTLNGVGSGTEIHHVQTHAGLDDGFEWFGGTVDAHHLIATDISDDSFDFSTGWQGRGQFWIAQQDPNDADTGYEVDGNERDGGLTPYTSPTVYNVTLVGKGETTGVAGESEEGVVLRRGTAGIYRNHIVLGFGDVGLEIDNAPTVTRLNDGLLEMTNSIVFGNGADFATDDDGIDERGVFLDTWTENRVVDPQLANPYDRSDPDFRPTAGSPALSRVATPPDDGFFDTSVDFIGAVGQGDGEWYKEGWTRWGG